MLAQNAAAQSSSYDASWYDSDAPHVKIAVVEDGVYQVTGSDIESALPPNTSLADLSLETLRLLENGSEVPLHVEAGGDGSFDAGDAFEFIGRRNRGLDELWAYENATDQSSSTYSLYADTTYYWLTWGGQDGRRYTTPSVGSTAETTQLRDSVHVEQDNRYYYGRSFESGDSFYTEAEGYYWNRFSLNTTGSTSKTYTLPVDRRVSSSDALELSVRLDAATRSCHRVEVEAELAQSGGGTAFEPIASREWRDYERQTLTASITQSRIPGDLQIRITSFNEGFSDSNCPDPANTPNYVLVDYLEAEYTRRLEAQNDQQRFVSPASGTSTFRLSGYESGEVRLYNEADAHRYAASASGGTVTVSDEASASNTAYWAVGASSLKSPADVQADAPSNWAAASNGADYVILTTRALQPSAEALADYREATNGYAVTIVTVQDIFDEFDYGRPTPIAIRRFVRATRSWSPAPQFLTIFADAEFPINEGAPTPRPSWTVPSFGYSPSDGWYAMQTGGSGDFSEFLAIGRVPVRTNAQGNLFVDKLEDYESAEPAAWQKRMLLLAGGTSESEQNSLQFYSDRWGEVATGTADSLYAAGMDTLRYYKQVGDALDTSFQDSLAVDLERGAGWLSYFGHSAAQTWEIVTDPPEEFGNAGRLPVIVSLGCKTGSFASDRFAEKGVPALGERFVVGALDDNGDPVPGAMNGGIAHWGTSALGNRFPSARLGDALNNRVFRDTMRVLGEAIRQAKAEVARNNGSSSVYQRHLLTYGLLGDPATRIAMADRPEFSITSQNIRTRPERPVPSDRLDVEVTVENFGLVPRDSVGLQFSWDRPDGRQVEQSVRLPRFAIQTSAPFSFSLDDQAVGTNLFRAVTDPKNDYDEVTEANNDASRELVVFDTGLALIAPSDRGIVSTRTPRLRVNVLQQATTTNQIEIEVDSVRSFDSPARQTTVQQSNDIVVDWTPSALEDGVTYYWRARLAGESESAWKSGAFTVRTDPETTAQWLQRDRLFQENEQTRLLRENRRWAFDEFNVTVEAFSERGGGGDPYGFAVNAANRYAYLSFGFSVLVLNGQTATVEASENFPTYNLADQYVEENGEQQEAVDSLRAFLDRRVQTGDYVFVRTRHLARQSGSTIPSEVQTLFRNLGSGTAPDGPYTTAVDTLTYNHIWTLKARKGHPEATRERVSPPGEASEVRGITLETEQPFSFPSGQSLTRRIGPAKTWDALQWTASGPSTAQVDVDVLAPQDSSILISASGLSGQQDLSSIDAASHRTLLLRATLTDSTRREAPQLKEWSVDYTPVPELAVDARNLASVPDTLLQGESASAELSVRHLTGPPAESVRLTTTVTDADNQETTIASDTLGTLSVDATAASSFQLKTDNRIGRNQLRISAASNLSPEPVPSNNTALRTVFVQSDQTPPSLAVFVEGRELPPAPDQISDLQDPRLPFVPLEPTFEIEVSDDNPFVQIADTSTVEVYLKEGLPEDNPDIISSFRRVPFSDPALTFRPPQGADSSKATVLYEPALDPEDGDGTYTLKVEAQDPQGNELDPYQVTFRVQQDQVIEDLYPYPNPMSSHTQFAFRIRGGNARPTDFTLRIYTLSGRLVREFGGTEVNDGQGLRTSGWNFLRWNGRDEDGDRVATGVYLYRVRMDGEDDTWEGDVEKIAVIR